MKKALIIIIITLGVLVLGFFILNRYIYNAKQAPSQDVSINSYEDCAAAGYPILESYPEKCQAPDGRTFTRKLTDEELANMAVPAIMRGVFTCLPHRDTSGPVTLECAYGFQAEDGNYYALKDENRDKGLFDLSIGEEVEIRGLFIPEKSEKYNSQGVIEIQELYVIEEEEEEVVEEEDVLLETDNYSFVAPSVNLDYASLRDWQVSLIDEKGVLLERVLDGQLVCRETAVDDNPNYSVSRITSDRAQYCLETASEGAAGSVYTEYSFYTLFSGDLIVIKFTAQYPQCYNYDDPEKTDCL
ncbi:MAG: hypothetical protein PHP81_03280, partial [Patescibacteria group bacterium]|nr:hypothetical protein [Patescibacteria group bacterium]